MASSKGSPIASLLVLSFAAVAAISLGVVSAQNTVPSCAAKLSPCASSLNSTSPPPACCNAIKEVVSTESERTCLCNLLKSPEILKTFQINITQALELPKRCGATADLTACNQGAPAPTAGGPPGTPGGNSASGLSTIGISGVAGLFLLWASLM